MTLENASYCFLNATYYNNEGEDVLAEVVAANEQFTDISLYRLTIKEFHELSKSLQCCKDFSLDDHYLRCNNYVTRIPLNNVIQGTKEVHLTNEISSFYTILLTGIKNEFLLVDSEPEFCEDGTFRYESRATVQFSSISFSKSTMSVYVPMFNKNGMYNKHLVTLEDGIFVSHNFNFLVPSDFNLSSDLNGCSFVRRVKIENKQYAMWKMHAFSVYDSNIILSAPLINKAMCIRERIRITKGLLNDYVNNVYSVLNYPKIQTPWVGGERSYESTLGVCFDSSIKSLSRKDKDDIIHMCGSEIIPNSSNLKEAMALLRERKCQYTVSFASAYLLCVMDACRDDVLGIVESSALVRADLNKKLFYADLYLYRVRVASYITHKKLAMSGIPFLSGGDETDYTFVKEGFKYDSE